MASSVWPQNKSKNSLFLIFVRQQSTSYTTILLVSSIQSDQTAHILTLASTYFVFGKLKYLINRLLILWKIEIINRQIGICETPNKPYVETNMTTK